MDQTQSTADATGQTSNPSLTDPAAAPAAAPAVAPVSPAVSTLVDKLRDTAERDPSQGVQDIARALLEFHGAA